MNACIFCPGPSLDSVYIELSKYDLRIAVNTAVRRRDLLPTHLLVSDDFGFCDSTKGVVYPCFLIHPDTWLDPDHPKFYEKWANPDDLVAFESYNRIPLRKESLRLLMADYKIGGNWRTYSFLTAVVWAAFSGAKKIDVYGADLCGTEYIRGDDRTTKWNTERRWKKERGILARLMWRLRKVCKIRRIKPPAQRPRRDNVRTSRLHIEAKSGMASDHRD